MLRPRYKSEKVQVVPYICFIRKIFSLNFKTLQKPSLFKALQKLCFLELYTSLGFWKIMTLDAALSVSCAVFVSASDRLLAKMSHFTLFAALFFSLAATEQKEEPVTWGQRSQRSHRCFDTWSAIWNMKPDMNPFERLVGNLGCYDGIC